MANKFIHAEPKPNVRATTPTGITVKITPDELKTVRDAQSRFAALDKLASEFSNDALEAARVGSIERFAKNPTSVNLDAVFAVNDRLEMNHRELALGSIERARTQIREHAAVVAGILNQIADQTAAKIPRLEKNEHDDAADVGGSRIATSSLPSVRAYRFAESLRKTAADIFATPAEQPIDCPKHALAQVSHLLPAELKNL